MPTISDLTQSNVVTQSHMVRGILEVMIERGAKDLFAVLPFLAFEGSTYKFTREDTLPTTHSGFDPYSTADLPEGVGTAKNIEVAVAAFGRNIDTPRLNVIGKSNINNQRDADAQRAAKKFAEDYLRGTVQGMGWSVRQLKGMDYWVDFWTDEGFTEQDVDASGGTFSRDLLNDLLSRQKTGEFDVIYADRQSTVEYLNILGDAGGALPTHYFDARFGRPVLSFYGKPWITLDMAGGPKTATGAALTDAGGGVTKVDIAAGDHNFPGFSKADVGRTISDGTNTSTIASVDSDNQGCTMDDGALGITGTKNLTVQRSPMIYAVRFSELDGYSAIYHQSMGGDIAVSTGEYYGPIAGFDAKDLGLLQGPDIFRSRITHYGNQVAHLFDSVARLRNFVYPA